MSYAEKLHDNTIRECRTLYPNDHYGKAWSCGEGWYPTISRLSYRLEVLNILYRRYNLRIVVDEVKEKFGTLRFYASVQPRIPLMYNFMERSICAVCEFIRKHVDFRLVSVTDRKDHMKMYVRCIDNDDHDRQKGSQGNNVTAERIIDGDNSTRQYVISTIRAGAERHKNPTRHKFLYLLYRFFDQHASLLDFSFLMPNAKERNMLMLDLHNRIHGYIMEAERECYGVCEICGESFNEKTNPRCETVGYVRYVCEKCASKTGRKYIKGGKIFTDGECVDVVPAEEPTKGDL